MKSSLYRPRLLVSLRALGASFAGIGVGTDGGVAIGAMACLAEVEHSAELRQVVPVLAETLMTHSNVRVRNVATLGGHLAHADPHMDLPPVLIALGAEIVAAGPRGERRVAIADLSTGYMETVLGGDELITALHIPPQRGRRAAYLKCTARSADDWPALGMAVSVAVEDGVMRDPRIVVGAATERAIRLPGCEALLAGRAADDRVLREAARAAAAEAPVIADAHGSESYKRLLIGVSAERALRRVLGMEARR